MSLVARGLGGVLSTVWVQVHAGRRMLVKRQIGKIRAMILYFSLFKNILEWGVAQSGYFLLDGGEVWEGVEGFRRNMVRRPHNKTEKGRFLGGEVGECPL